jgi:hypothetical protein
MDSPPLLSAATFVSIINNNRVTVAGVAGVALEADDLGAPGARGVRASSLVLELMDSLLLSAARRWSSLSSRYVERRLPLQGGD